MNKNNKHNFKDLSGQKFGKLTILSYIDKRIWLCQCDCGNICEVHGGQLKTNRTKSCGCLRKELAKSRASSSCGKRSIRFKDRENKIVNGIKFIEYHKSVGNKTIWKLKCKCGKIFEHTPYTIESGKVRSCGYCGNFRNGIATSYKAIQIHTIINRGIHNYKSHCGAIIDIAFVKNGKKVAVEYDEWYWHGDKQEEDKKRINKLISNGWKILQIKANKNIPSEEEIHDSIRELINNDINIKIITLDNWGFGETIKQHKSKGKE